MNEGDKIMHKKLMRKTMPRRRIVIMVSAIFICLIAAAGIVYKCNDYYIELSIPQLEEIQAEYGESYDDSDVIALYKGTLLNRKGTQIPVTSSGNVDVRKLGTYEVTYTASYKNLTASAKRVVTVEDKLAPVISLVSDPENYTSPVGTYEEEGYTATDNYDGDLTDQVVRVEKDGVVTYTVKDSFGNETTVTREIRYKDVVPPVIQLAGGTDITMEIGSEYQEPGFTATDDCDGDITDNVKVKGTVDGSAIGNYQLTYTVQDAAENEYTVTRNVKVADTTAPEISLKGDTSVFIQKGTDYEDAGYTALDGYDGDVTADVKVEGSVDTNKIGVYTVKYSVWDNAGNTGTSSRTVYVYEKQADVKTIDPGDKVVYLTFDDGPGKYTQQLLDVLDKYNVKVTFFVTNQYPKYQNLIGEEYKRGHTVAIHSYSHKYSTIYQSEEAFYSDIEKMNDICEELTGVRATILRFPGGGSNTVSRKYCSGIMTALTKSVEKMGYQYTDWNVTSGDAGETKSTEQVKNNVIKGMKEHNVSVVLQHDTQGFSVDAVEGIVVWGLANGYTFLPMEDSSPMAHHSVNN